MLLQDERHVVYASRSLTDAESRYADIEKRLLAVQFSLERFNQYTYGKRVTTESDHKPLEAIVKKELTSAPPRLQRILLRIPVPSSMRKEMLQRIHQGLMGMEKSKRRARDVLYRPGMNSQNSDMISRCTTCLEHQQRNTKESMIPSCIPSKPREMAPTDLFTWEKSEYLIIVDYHSRYFEVAKLSDTKSTTVITYTKSMFARRGIPSEMISDNGHQYSLKDFSLFAKQWEFKHATVSPQYPQANGLVEKKFN